MAACKEPEVGRARVCVCERERERRTETQRHNKAHALYLEDDNPQGVCIPVPAFGVDLLMQTHEVVPIALHRPEVKRQRLIGRCW